MMARISGNGRARNRTACDESRVTTMNALLLAYGGVSLFSILFVAGFGLAIYFNNHGSSTLADISWYGACASMGATVLWLMYFFNDKGGY